MDSVALYAGHVQVGRRKKKASGDPLGGKRLASLYRRGQTYVVTAHRRFGYGPWYRSPPYAVLSRTASDEELGAAVVSAIESFEYMVEEPARAEIEAWNSELYAVVRVKDEATFERGASLIQIIEHAGRWVVEPQDRRRGYWVPRHEEAFLHLTRPAAEEVGGAVRRALDPSRLVESPKA